MKDKSRGFATGAVIGALAGVVAGILFAPKSGKETRQDIKEASKKVAEKISVEARKLQAELTDLIDVAESKARVAGQAVSEKSKELIARAKHERDALAVLLKSVKSGEADDKDLDRAIKKAKEAKEALSAYLKK